MAGIGKAIKGLGLLAKKYKKGVAKKASVQTGKKRWKKSEHMGWTKKEVEIEMGDRSLMSPNKKISKKKYIKRNPHEGEPSQSSDWPYWRGDE